jgi:hypothetical protein
MVTCAIDPCELLTAQLTGYTQASTVMEPEICRLLSDVRVTSEKPLKFREWLFCIQGCAKREEAQNRRRAGRSFSIRLKVKLNLLSINSAGVSF